MPDSFHLNLICFGVWGLFWNRTLFSGGWVPDSFHLKISFALVCGDFFGKEIDFLEGGCLILYI